MNNNKPILKNTNIADEKKEQPVRSFIGDDLSIQPPTKAAPTKPTDFRYTQVVRKSTIAAPASKNVSPNMNKLNLQKNSTSINDNIVARENFVDYEEVDNVFNNLLSDIRKEKEENTVVTPNHSQQVIQQPVPGRVVQQPMQQAPQVSSVQQPIQQPNIQTYVNAQGQLVQRVYTNAQGQPVPAPQGQPVPGRVVQQPMQQAPQVSSVQQPMQQTNVQTYVNAQGQLVQRVYTNAKGQPVPAPQGQPVPGRVVQQPMQQAPQVSSAQQTPTQIVEKPLDPLFDLSDIFGNGDNEKIEETQQTSTPLNEQQVEDNESSKIVVTQEMGHIAEDEGVDLSDLFAEETDVIFEEEPIENNEVFKDNPEFVKQEGTKLEAVEEIPFEEAFDLSDIFNDEEQIESNNTVLDAQLADEFSEPSDTNSNDNTMSIQSDEESSSDTFQENFDETINLSDIFNDSDIENEGNNTIENPTNVFDAFGIQLTKNQFITEYVTDEPLIFDFDGNQLTKDQVAKFIDEDAVVVCDDDGNVVIKLILLKEVNAAIKEKELLDAVESNILNEFNKPVNKEELLKEYSTNVPNLFDFNSSRLSKEELLVSIENGTLYIAEYGVKLDYNELLKELKDTTTSVFDRNNNVLNKEELIIAINSNSDLYDKYENQIYLEYIVNKINNKTLNVLREDGKKATKEELLKDVCGFIELYDVEGNKLTKSNVKQYIESDNISIYNKKKKILTSEEILNIFNENDISIPYEYEILLSGKKSNIFSEYGDPLTRVEFITEYRNVLPKLYNSMSKKLAKKDIIDLIEDGTLYIAEDGVIVDVYKLVNELRLNINGVFTKEKESLSTEELISELQQKSSVYDFNGNELTLDILINNIRYEIISVYDLNGDKTSIIDLIEMLESNYTLSYNHVMKQLSKDEVVEQLNNGNKVLFNSAGVMMNTFEILDLLKFNNIELTEELNNLITSEENKFIREFPDINLVDDYYNEHEDVYKDVVRATLNDNNVMINSYNLSYEARLNQTNDFIKDYHNLIKNKLLSFEKSKSKISWNFDTYTVGKITVARLDVEIDTLYLYLNINVSELNPEFIYKDYSDKKTFASTPIRIKINSINDTRLAYELLDFIAQTNGINVQDNFNMVDYYEESKPFSLLLSETLIKEVSNSKDSKELTHIDKSVLDQNKINYISKEAVGNIKIVNEVYNDAINSNSREKNTDRKTIVHLDTISKLFIDGEIVNIDSLKNRNVIPSDVTFVKCNARGVLSKALVFELDDYSRDAVKMILITNGTIQ